MVRCTNSKIAGEPREIFHSPPSPSRKLRVVSSCGRSTRMMQAREWDGWRWLDTEEYCFVENGQNPRPDKGISRLTDARIGYPMWGERNVSSVVTTYSLPVLMCAGGGSAGGMNEHSRALLDGQKMFATLIQAKPAPAVGLKSNGRRRSILLQMRVSAWRFDLVPFDVARGSSWAAACSR